MMRIQNRSSVGIDLAKQTFDVALAPEGIDPDCWRTLPHSHIAYPPDSQEGIKALVLWLQKRVGTEQCERIVVESTGSIAHRFAAALEGHGLPEVAIINPARSKAFICGLGIRDKTDRIDAAGLAIFAAIRKPKPTRARSKAEQNLRRLTRLREDYNSTLTAWKNRLQEADDRSQRTMIKTTIRHLEKQLHKIDAKIELQIEADECLSQQVAAIKQIKGLKQVCACTLTAEMGDLTQYTRSQVVAAAGIYPRHRESGTSVRGRPRMVKGGGARVRRVLYMASTSLFHSNGPLRDQIDRYQTQGLAKMVIIGIMMRKLLLIARAVVRNNGVYEPLRIGHAQT